MKELPKTVKAYKKTDIFDEHTVPKGLLNNHSTQANVWGKINVLEGRLLYTIQSEPVEEVELSDNQYGVVEPEVLHHVRPLGKVRFFVEFYR